MKTKEEKIIEEIELSFLDVIGTVWGLTIDTNVSDDKMKYFNNKGVEIRNELIKKVRKLLSSSEKKEEVGFDIEVPKKRNEQELKEYIAKHQKEVEKEEPTQEFTKEELRYLVFVIGLSNQSADSTNILFGNKLIDKIERLLK